MYYDSERNLMFADASHALAYDHALATYGAQSRCEKAVLYLLTLDPDLRVAKGLLGSAKEPEAWNIVRNPQTVTMDQRMVLDFARALSVRDVSAKKTLLEFFNTPYAPYLCEAIKICWAPYFSARV